MPFLYALLRILRNLHKNIENKTQIVTSYLLLFIVRTLQEILLIGLIVNNKWFFQGKGGLLLQKLQFEDWIIDIDKEITRKYYESILVSSECQCLYCKNYREACNFLTSQVKNFFDNLGIIPHREGEFAEVAIDDKTHMYTGFYHLVGNIIQGPINVKQNWHNISLIAIGNFKFAFSREVQIVPQDFPKPVIQLEFETKIPWLLNESP